MCAASGSALGKEKIKMKKEVVINKQIKHKNLICLYNIAYLLCFCCRIVNKL